MACGYVIFHLHFKTHERVLSALCAFGAEAYCLFSWPVRWACPPWRRGIDFCWFLWTFAIKSPWPPFKKGDVLFANCDKQAVYFSLSACPEQVPLGEGGLRGIDFCWFCGFSPSNPPDTLSKKGHLHFADCCLKIALNFYVTLLSFILPDAECIGVFFVGRVLLFAYQMPLREINRREKGVAFKLVMNNGQVHFFT